MGTSTTLIIGVIGWGIATYIAYSRGHSGLAAFFGLLFLVCLGGLVV